jgi:hypothetical protein
MNAGEQKLNLAPTTTEEDRKIINKGMKSEH